VTSLGCASLRARFARLRVRLASLGCASLRARFARLRVATGLLCALAAANAFAQGEGGTTLVRYSFDDGQVDTGPDTFAVYENARGSVELASEWRVSGAHSVEIRDVAGDGDFPELVGGFEPRRDGVLFAHFALLVSDPNETANAVLAGPAGFHLGKDAIAFWLLVRDGWLGHVSDSIPRRLLRPRPFVWYRVDLAYDVARGRYDLTVGEEGRKDPVVQLTDQPNAASQPRSTVDRFSFVGEAGGDDSNAVYYVDDILIGTDRSVALEPLVAPGRRRLFIEALVDERERLRERMRCPLASEPAELGLSAAQARALLDGTLDDARLRDGVRRWVQGCAALESGDGVTALAAFEAAAAALPDAPLPLVAAALALATAGRADDASRRFDALPTRWLVDPRWLAWRAALARAQGDPDEHDARLRQVAEAARTSREALPAELHASAGEAFWIALDADRLDEAERLALALAEGATPPDLRAGWLERAGDVAALLQDFARGVERYEAAVALDAGRASAWLKLSDLHFLRGDFEGERRCRERIFGSLRPQPVAEGGR
jgi:hypothetical protein